MSIGRPSVDPGGVRREGSRGGASGGRRAGPAGARAPIKAGAGAGAGNPHAWSPQILWAIILTAVPAAALLGLGSPRPAGLVFWGLFAVYAGYLVCTGRHAAATAYSLGLTPFPSLFRDFAFYSVVIVLFIGLLVLLWAQRPQETARLLVRNRLVLGLLVYMGVYYVLTLIITREYANNVRLIEFAVSAACVVLVGRDTRLLSTVLFGIVICSCLMGLAFLPHNADIGRLGIAKIGGYHMGNPIQLGLPLALGFVALTADGARWMGLAKRPFLRACVFMGLGVLLALTTSRASWMVAIASTIVVLLFGAQQRLRLIVVLFFAAGALQLALMTKYGGELEKGLERTFDGGRDVRNRTSGRSDQWKVAYNIWSDSATSMLFGCGPGLGADAYAKFSQVTEGVEFRIGQKMSLHSLFMQVWAECGLLGLVPVVLGLVVAFRQVLARTMRSRLVFPLACLCGYLLIVLTVSGSDTISGIFLGCGFLFTGSSGTDAAPRGMMPGPRGPGVRRPNPR